MFGASNHPVFDREIVGVVADIRGNSREPARATLYYPFTQWQDPEHLIFYVRSAGDAAALGPAIRAAAREVDPNIPVSDMSPLTMRIADSIYVARVLAMLSSAFGVLATLLAALGLYGIVAFTVARRTAEIGLRMALGAQPGDMLRMVVLEAARLAAGGHCDWVGRRFGSQPASRVATVRRRSGQSCDPHMRRGVVGAGGPGCGHDARGPRRAHQSGSCAEVRIAAMGQPFTGYPMLSCLSEVPCA